MYRACGISVLLMILISVSITMYYSITRQTRYLDDSITNMAAVLAQSPTVIRTLEGKETPEAMQNYIEQVRKGANPLDIITVCDENSVRLYHPDGERIGKVFIGGDEAEILAGAEPYITDGTGTLGPQHRAFHAVKNDQGQVIGFVMASVLTVSIRKMRNQIIILYVLLAAVLLGVAAALTRETIGQLRKLLLGYQPEEFVTRYVERSEVLNVLDEGMFAINPEGRVILMNQSARNMLGLPDTQTVEGELLTDIYPDTRLPEVLHSGQPQYNVTMLLNGNHILTSRLPLIEGGRIAGAITIFRDKTEVMKLANDLTGARDMLDTLRAFNHEFMNKLHVILGYLQLGQNEQAMEYIANTTLVSSQVVREVTNNITVSHLSALIIGKMMRASELGIQFRLKQGSHCTEDSLLISTESYVTIIGNLLENAIEELNAHNYPLKEIELGFYCDPEGTLITCEDTGGGISPQVKAHIFEQGISTKGSGRGTGLPVVKDLVERYGGEISIDTEEGEGTCFTISFLPQEAGVVPEKPAEGENDVSSDDC